MFSQFKLRWAYKEGISDAQKEEFRSTFHCALASIVHDTAYAAPMVEEKHVSNITILAESLKERHKKLLRNENFRIGPAQKALNLYLKYLWCSGDIPTTPHCPLDATVMRKLSPMNRCKWTQLDDIEQYCAMIEDAKARAAAENRSMQSGSLIYGASRGLRPS